MSLALTLPPDLRRRRVSRDQAPISQVEQASVNVCESWMGSSALSPTPHPDDPRWAAGMLFISITENGVVWDRGKRSQHLSSKAAIVQRVMWLNKMGLFFGMDWKCQLLFYVIYVRTLGKRLDGSNDLKLKGRVHPKINILSSFTYPQVVPNLYKFFSPFLLNTEPFLLIPMIWYVSLLWKSMLPATVWLPTFLKISSWYSTRAERFWKII